MYCAECGTANSTGAETCEICGSPLGLSTGDHSCHVCGAPMSETDRFCRACGQSQSGAAAGRYEPGPSFVDDSSLQVDPFELPPWLREMTSSVAGGPDGFPSAPTSTVAQNDGLPPWFDAASTGNGAENSSASQPSPGWSKPASRPNDESMAEFSLISEDDLPEWLRALGDQEFDLEPTPITPTNGTTASVPPPPALVTPTVSRAWLSRPRTIENETAEEVASDFVPIESSAAAEPARKPTSAPNVAAPPGDSTESLPVASAAPSVAQALADPRRVRLISLSVIVVIVVIVAFYALLNLL